MARGLSPESSGRRVCMIFLVYCIACFLVLLCICVVSCPYVIYYPTAMVRYSLFVLKVPLNPKQTNQQTNFTGFPFYIEQFCLFQRILEQGAFVELILSISISRSQTCYALIILCRGMQSGDFFIKVFIAKLVPHGISPWLDTDNV